MDSFRRTSVNALTAQTALVEIDVSHVVANGDSTKRTGLLALATSYAGSLTSFHGNSTFVFVDA
jgi:hypothetical protein